MNKNKKMTKEIFFKFYGFLLIMFAIAGVVISVISGGLPPGLDEEFDKALPLGEKGYIVRVESDSAEVFDPERDDARSLAAFSPLPKGTLDYAFADEAAVRDGDSEKRFRRLLSGKKIISSVKNDDSGCDEYVKLFYDALPKENKISFYEKNETKRHIEYYFDTLWKAPFSVRLYPCDYFVPEVTFSGYDRENTKYEYLDICFDYCTALSCAPKLSVSDPLFSSCEVISCGDYFALRLYLKTPGKFYGYGTRYDDCGRLVFSFLKPPLLIDDPEAEYGVRLDNCTVLLDPGHGDNAPGAIGTLGNISLAEKDINLVLADKTAEKLRKTGAEVILTRENDVNPSLYERTGLIRSVKPDVFISMHRNYSQYNIVNGYENYIFTPYSHPLADILSEYCGGLFNVNRETRYGKTMYVTRVTECPAVLCEDGYMSDELELSKMTGEKNINETAEKYVAAIVSYFISAA